ncbi:DEAD/DEAH box helicase [Brevundimonas sp. UBA7534]|uniref:DEAD/DEAH box helicase n=1 Tax=Brevundimonas sp. UBA7534 TaxID=1946138 RepID=UPI0025C12C5F|nr:DEAD/DEAH box helicase [Brevundimonas sp. UBA7534]
MSPDQPGLRDSEAEGLDWIEAGQVRCRDALRVASAPADRLALIRSFTRLCDGLLSLEREGLTLNDEESALLDRFALARTGDGRLLRLVEENTAPAELGHALRLDPGSRRAFIPASADGVLRRSTTYPAYRHAAQKAAVRAMATQPPGSGLMVSMPTGSGKSLLFQIAALEGRRSDPGACVLVITPTIALALDHARSLSAIPGLEGSRALTSDTTAEENALIVDAFRRGEVPVLLLSPEKALNPGVADYLAEAASPTARLPGLNGRLTHLFVDEAHIIETWGRNFRPDFQRLPSLLNRLRFANPAVRAILLSATLPPSARRMLKDSWGLGSDWLEIDAQLPRYDCDVVVQGFESATERDAVLRRVIDRAPRPAVVYVTEVADANALYGQLTSQVGGYRRAALFTGATTGVERKRIIAEWARDDLDLVVATSAFGLGIDKSNVRSVIHACLPESAARWYQEIGRASRDGGQGLAVCLFTDGFGDSDVTMAFGLATKGLLSREIAVPRWAAMLDQAEDSDLVGGHRQITLKLDSIRVGLAPQSSDYNRQWNRSLLTLMQRANAIKVLSVGGDGDEPGDSWRVELTDPALSDPLDAAPWDRIYLVRDAELGQIRGDLVPFEQMMRDPVATCITRRAFEMIEALAMAPPCGRCPACRATGTKPPDHLFCGGLNQVWDTPAEGVANLPKGVLLLEPDDLSSRAGFAALLARLSEAGFQQFVIPDALAEQTAEALKDLPGLGQTLTAREWSGDTRPARLATAVILDEADPIAAGQLHSVASQSRLWPDVVWCVVGEGRRKLGGRRLDQVVSAHAPLSEGALAAPVPDFGVSS